ncbi:MAG: DNA-directed RNA polymerase subunit D [Candidatus Bathyarchaeia archaeon]
MHIQVLEKTENHIRFTLSDSNPAFANSLRRIMIAEVPSMTIEDVFFYENLSAINDELIAHRLGLIPLKTDLDSYVLPSKCDCNSEMGCNKCRAIASLEADANDEVRTVYSGDLKFENPEIEPASNRIPIAKLAPGQRIRFEAHARLGIGRQNAKWQPVSACAYKLVENSFLFFVESTGCLPPERIITEAATILGQKSTELAAEVKAEGKKV